MKGTAKMRKKGVPDLFASAEEVFSKAYVDELKGRGHGFLESGRDGPYVYDEQGKRYLDCFTSAGTYNLGRRNPAIVARLKKAIPETDQGNFVMLSEEKALLARRIADFVPGSLSCVLFGATRGECMDAACKLARGFTQRPGLVTVDGGSYGETGFALSLSERKGKEQFGELIPGITVVPFGDEEALRSAINGTTAAFVMEPIQAENGCREAGREYFALARSLCDRHGAKLVFDETQSGFGRTGSRFFFEQTGVEPDILILGEAITSGVFPMTTLVFTPELKAFFDVHPLIHLCTFGGHDLGCRAALAALDEYDRQSPWDMARETGERLLQELSKLAGGKSPLRSVTGRGLLISLKLRSEKAARAFIAGARDNGLFVSSGTVDHSCIVLRPSLLIGDPEVSLIVDAVGKTLESL
ncbi:MAG: aspartate aminotransferase family protein [Desulfomonilia bacterium]